MSADNRHLLVSGDARSGQTEHRYQPIPMYQQSDRGFGQQPGLQLPPPPPQQNMLGSVQAQSYSEYWFESASSISAVGCELPADEPLTPSAPPYSEMDKIFGYDDILNPNVAYVAPPPSYQEAISNIANTTVENFVTGSSLTEFEARELLIALAKSKCCWSKRAAEHMRIKTLQQSTAVHYLLKTFLETRSTDWASEPFRGQMVDGPHNGAAPLPWEIEVPLPEMFHDTVTNVEVPHTASVRGCHRCHGSGSIRCTGCCGLGRNRCFSCNGTGAVHCMQQDAPRRMCLTCDGNGQRLCERCRGRGQTTCTVCEATGQVKYFVKLTVTFKTHTKDFILERSLLPNQLIREVPGLILYEDTQQLLIPIQSFPERDVNAESAKLIQEHRGLAQTGRIWMQNHVIRGVPVFQCDCQWKDKEFQFFVYGDNRCVHTDDYPQTCCCGCQLL